MYHAQFRADDFVESVTHDKAFLHFMLKTPSLVRAVLTQVHELTYDAPSDLPEYSTNPSGAGKKVIIEYSSPNIAKSFHVGHLTRPSLARSSQICTRHVDWKSCR